MSSSEISSYDIVVVGGGVLGTSIARDAAQRGLSVALFEAQDFGGGAAASSSRLALGGLSALGTLDFTQVREDIIAAEQTGLNPLTFNTNFVAYLSTVRNASDWGFTAPFLAISILALAGLFMVRRVVKPASTPDET